MRCMENRGCGRFTCRMRAATGRIARLRRHMAVLHRKGFTILFRSSVLGTHPCVPVKPNGFTLAIAGYYASLRLALHHRKRTLQPVQLRILVWCPELGSAIRGPQSGEDKACTAANSEPYWQGAQRSIRLTEGLT